MAGKVNSRNLVTIISVAILVGTEILGAALALGWAVGGLMELGPTLTNGLIGICLLAGAYVIWRFVRHAMTVEPIVTRDGG